MISVNPRQGMSKSRRIVSQSAIARKAGVARTTASLALRGGEGLSPATVARVMAAAEQLGYRPNNLVHAIRSGRTRIIGVLVPPIDTYWATVAHGIHDELVANDLAPMNLWPRHGIEDPDDDFQAMQLHRLFDWRVDGAIMWPKFALMFERWSELHRPAALPLVTLDAILERGEHHDAVLSDEKSAAVEVCAHLAAFGHREVLHLAGPREEMWSRQRRDFLTECAAEHGIHLSIIELPLVPPRTALIAAALANHPLITAVICATDRMAEETYLAAADLGLAIPHHLSVLGHGDIDLCQRLDPPLSSVRQSPYEIGVTAAKLVIERIDGNLTGPRPAAILPSNLITRGSVGPARGLAGAVQPISVSPKIPPW